MYLTIGVCGHIDHGKTTLVRALSGMETDRLAEEQRRGISIDLGFAYLRIGETTLAFVDVPGHERFVHNMLAGAAGIDAVLLVVAADEGVMPQTREHLHICEFLGLPRGVVALNRIDLADPDLCALSEEELRTTLRGSFLEQAHVCPVSATRGTGLPALRDALLELAAHPPRRSRTAPFRMFVDRVFTQRGFGTVVTGTVASGTLRQGDETQHYPLEKTLRVRGLQVHGQAASEVFAGQRAAVNLASVSREQITRGDQLAQAQSLLRTRGMRVALELLDDIGTTLRPRTRVRVHLGSQSIPGYLLPLEGSRFCPGETQLAQLRLSQETAARYGDRFILRNETPRYTLGGGTVIDPQPAPWRGSRESLIQALTRLASAAVEPRVEEAIRLQGLRGLRREELPLRCGLEPEPCAEIFAQLGAQARLLPLGETAEALCMHIEAAEHLAKRVETALKRFHRVHAERTGARPQELGAALGSTRTERERVAFLGWMARHGQIHETQGQFHLPAHKGGLREREQAQLAQILELIEAGGAQPPRRHALLVACGLPSNEGLRILQIGAHSGRLVRVKEDLYYAPARLAALEAQLRTLLESCGTIDVAGYKTLAGVSRKYAVDLLEYFDGRKLTMRLGDHRVLRNPHRTSAP